MHFKKILQLSQLQRVTLKNTKEIDFYTEKFYVASCF